MQKSLRILLVLGIVLSSTFVYAQTDISTHDKEQITKAIRYVMKFAGGEALKTNIKYSAADFIAQKVPQDIVADVMDNIATQQADEVAQKIFNQYFTVADARAINEFYESPVGKKFTQKIPFLAMEYSKQSPELTLKAYQEIFDQLKAKGYPLDDLRKKYLSPAQFTGSDLSNTTSVDAMEKD